MEQLPLLQPDSTWVPPSEFPSLEHAPCIAVDIETCDPGLTKRGSGWARDEGYIVGVSVAVEDWVGYYPVRHQNGGNLDRGMVWAWLRDVLSRPEQPKIFANSQYDVGWLIASGIVPQGKLYDVQAAAALIDENRLTYRLDALGRDYLGERKDETLLNEAADAWGVDRKAGLWKLPSTFVGPYAEQDALLTLKLWEWQQPRLERDNLWPIFELETELTPLLILMRKRGVRVDEERAAELRRTWVVQESLLLDQLAKEAGRALDVWSGLDLQKAYDRAGVSYPRTEAGSPSFTAEWLATQSDPVSKLVLKVRKLNKARSAFIDNMIGEHTHKGRIHCTFNPLRSDSGGALKGTVTGRFSCSDPNLQQVPAHDKETGPAIRKLFLPEEGHVWGSFDYSSQEPRLAVHYAALLRLPGALEAAAAYHNDPTTDFHQLVADLAGIKRKDAKTINLGVMYGMGQKKLADKLGLSQGASDKLMAKYHEALPFMKGLANAAMTQAAQKGFLRSTLGRRFHFDRWEPAGRRGFNMPYDREKAEKEYRGEPLKRAFTYKALNKLIQGSAGDMMKAAMSDMFRKHQILPCLTIHDEVAVSLPADPVEQKRMVETVVGVMTSCVPGLEVPMRVDVEIGKTWGDAK